jgi:hypothetical protein
MSYPSEPDPNEPNYPHEFRRDTEEESMTMAAWTGIAFVVLLFGTVMVYAFTSDRTDVALRGPAAIERTEPPTTTGQGGS